MKTTRPITLNKKNILEISNIIIEYIKDTYYKKIADIYKQETRQDIFKNALSNLIMEALKQNKIYVEGHYVKGKFNSRIVKELEKAGGVYRKKGYYFDTLPIEINNYISANSYKIKTIASKVDDLTDQYLSNLDESLKYLNVDYLDTINNYEGQLKQNLKDFSIVPDISEAENKAINDNYILETKKYIKGFLELETNKLRNEIKDYVLKDGYSNKYIADIIQNSYGLTQRRATFIARQESSLLLAEYNKAKMQGLGLNRYKWSTAKDEKVRDYPKNNSNGEDHKRLDGLIFTYDNPPIVNVLTGERANPSERFNCRCLALPVID